MALLILLDPIQSNQGVAVRCTMAGCGTYGRLTGPGTRAASDMAPIFIPCSTWPLYSALLFQQGLYIKKYCTL